MPHESPDNLVPNSGSPVADGLIDTEWNQTAWGNLEANLEFLSRTGLAPPANILEIGCGKGAMLQHLRLAGYTVAGMDIDASALSHFRRRCPGVPVCLASGAAIPFADGSFDAVLSFDVFEHIQDSDRHLAEVTRVLRRGGRYLLQTPNKWTNIPFEILRQAVKFHTGPIASYRELMQDHCALHNYWQLRRRLVRHGFDVSFVDIPVVNDYFRTKMRNYLGAMGPLLTRVLNPDRFPRPLRTNFYVIASLRGNSAAAANSSRNSPSRPK